MNVGSHLTKGKLSTDAFMILFLVLLASHIAFVRAQPPPIPVTFSGSVTLNGVPVPDGLNIIALDRSQIVVVALHA